MNFQMFEINNQKIAKVMAEQVVITNAQEALDLIANAYYQEATGIIIEERQLDFSFFDLRSGLAGELLQKCANYQMKLAVIGEFEKFKSESLQAFILECNRGRAVSFVADTETAISKITS